jgi:DNA mismatch endonuclease Vsr
LRYRVSSRELAGRPDIVFARARVAVFCDGDFWHGKNLHARVERLKSNRPGEDTWRCGARAAKLAECDERDRSGLS